MSTASVSADLTSRIRRVRDWAEQRRNAAHRRSALESALAGDHGPGVQADVRAAQRRAAA